MQERWLVQAVVENEVVVVVVVAIGKVVIVVIVKAILEVVEIAVVVVIGIYKGVGIYRWRRVKSSDVLSERFGCITINLLL